jgi:hypothetical protein
MLCSEGTKLLHLRSEPTHRWYAFGYLTITERGGGTESSRHRRGNHLVARHMA